MTKASHSIDGSTIYKKCTCCHFEWDSPDDLLKDPGIEVIGYQAHFEELTEGVLLVNHSCGGTLGVRAGDFQHLYDGPVFNERATGSDECPGYCLHKSELRPCPAKCECAYVREIIQIMKNWPKRSATD